MIFGATVTVKRGPRCSELLRPTPPCGLANWRPPKPAARTLLPLRRLTRVRYDDGPTFDGAVFHCPVGLRGLVEREGRNSRAQDAPGPEIQDLDQFRAGAPVA